VTESQTVRPGRTFALETWRKAIHVGTIVAPLLVWILPGQVATPLLVTAVAVALALEWARAEVRWVRRLFLTRTRRLLRPHERRSVSGATWLAVGYLLAYLLFPLPIAVAAMLYGGLADAAAGLVGRRWGRWRVAWGKSAEGAIASFATCLLIGLAIPELGPLAAMLGAAAAALVEFLPLPGDDNLRVTLLGGGALWLAASLA
jgi:dolichol kinase